MYLGQLQNWLYSRRGLLICLFLVLFWLSETGQFWGFRAFPGEPIKEMAWRFCMLMYRDHLQSWLIYGYSLLIFVILVQFWLSGTGQIWCFRPFWWCSVDFLHDPFDWNWSYLECLCCIWRTGGSKYRGGGGIFPTLCVKFCPVLFIPAHHQVRTIYNLALCINPERPCIHFNNSSMCEICTQFCCVLFCFGLIYLYYSVVLRDSYEWPAMILLQCKCSNPGDMGPNVSLPNHHIETVEWNIFGLPRQLLQDWL